MRIAVENALNAIIITDPAERILYVNPAAEKICGYASAEMIGKKPGQLLQGPGTDEVVKRQIGEAIRAKRPVKAELLNYRKSGEPYWVEMQIVPVLDEEDNVTHFLSVEVDISQHKQMVATIADKNELLQMTNEILSSQTQQLIAMNRTLEQLSTTDALTQLGNHRLFYERLTASLDFYRFNQTPLHCALLDADHFKGFNDEFGHLAGDHVLSELGRILREATDTLGAAFRYGGEEFAILYLGSEESAVIDHLEQIRRTVEGNDWSHRPVTVSIGLAQVMPSDSSGSDILDRADKCLYEAKASGRNRLCHHLGVKQTMGLDSSR